LAFSADGVRERYERIREQVGPAVTIVTATKYVALEDLGVLVEAGVEVVGENRAQDLQAKHAAYGDAFRWHFIGKLQSRKATIVNGICELCHSLETESAARRLEIPALIRRRRARSSAGCASSRRHTDSPSSRWGRARTTASPWTKAQRSSGSEARSTPSGVAPRPPVAGDQGFPPP
jgi:hypothetical protein